MATKSTLQSYDSMHGSKETVAKRVYLHDKSYCSTINDNVLFSLREKISLTLRIPINGVVLAGSAHIGWSVRRNTSYDRNTSDLDFAVIDSGVFQLAINTVVSLTGAYTNNTRFERTYHLSEFRDYASRGIIRPELLPRCDLKSQWLKLNSDLTREAIAIAQKASFVVYLSETLFIGKQLCALNKIRGN